VVLHGYRLEKMIVERNKLNAEIERVADLIAANANFLPEAERAKDCKNWNRWSPSVRFYGLCKKYSEKESVPLG